MTLLKERYDLSGKTDLDAKMSGGKPLPVGPQKLSNGIPGNLGAMSSEEVKQKGVFPYPPLPHVKMLPVEWSWLMQKTHPELVRFDVDFGCRKLIWIANPRWKRDHSTTK